MPRWLMMAGGVILAFMLFVFCVWELPFMGRLIYHDLPDISDLENINFDQSSVILDRHGQEIYKIYGDQNRKYVSLDNISRNMINATIAIEDKDFYHHSGVDFMGIIRATVANFTRSGSQQGASTITQQLVRNLWPDIISPYEKSLNRKVKEALVSHYIEEQYDKDKILELYLNKVSFVSNTYGVEQAAQGIFGVSAKDLTVAQSAILASLYKSPTYYSPYRSDRWRLLGKCTTGAERSSEDAAATVSSIGDLVITIKPTQKLWLKVTPDEGEADERMIDAGDETQVTIQKQAAFVFGNLKFKILVNGVELKTPAKKSWVLKKSEIESLVVNPAEWKKVLTDSVITADSSTCTGLDDPNYVWGRKDLVLNAMYENQMITQEERDQAWQDANKLQFKKPKEKIRYPHFLFYVKDQLESMYGKEVVSRGGLVVKTTIDPEIQEMAEKLVEKYAKSNEARYAATNAALVAIDNKSGEILAMVGSRDYYDESHDGNVNVVTSLRQPGSSFKPFIYAAMMNNVGRGYGAGTVLYDVETAFGDGPPPQNYEGGFKGPMTVRNALAQSRNIPAIKAFFLAGGDNPEDVILDFVGKFGFNYLKERRTELAKLYGGQYFYGWPMALGTAEVRLLDMAQGYTVFANGGYYKEASPFIEIRNNKNNLLYQEPESVSGVKVLDEQIAYIITSILSDKDARPAGMWRNNLTLGKYPNAVKTGTSNKRLNAHLIRPSNTLTIGFTPYLTVGVWAGNNNGDVMSPSADGLNVAAPLWKEFMLTAHDVLKLDPKVEFKRPEGVTDVVVSRLSGKKAGKQTPKEFLVRDLFPSFNIPTDFDDSVRLVQIDKRNNLLATEECPPDAVESRFVLSVHAEAPFPKWEKAVLSWAAAYSGKLANSLSMIPKETSPLCAAISDNQRPQIQIVSPRPYSEVSPGMINVAVDTQAVFEVQRVDYYVNDEKVYTSTTSPYTGFINLGTTLTAGTEVNIKAVVTDKNLWQGEATVTVKTGSDTLESKPSVSIISPTSGESLREGGNITIAVKAYDENGVIEKVELYDNGGLLGSRDQEPYRFNYLPKTLGDHTIMAVAYGRGDKKVADSITLTVVEKAVSPAGGDEVAVSIYGSITEPASGAVVSSGGAVRVVAEVPLELKDKLASVAIVKRNLTTGTREEIYRNHNVNTNYFVTYTVGGVGKHELVLKIVAKDGRVELSPKVVFEVQ